MARCRVGSNRELKHRAGRNAPQKRATMRRLNHYRNKDFAISVANKTNGTFINKEYYGEICGRVCVIWRKASHRYDQAEREEQEKKKNG